MYRVNISAPNLMSVCVNEFHDGGPVGSVYHKYSREGLVFHNVFELLQHMEYVMDYCRYPQPSTRIRTFGNKEYQYQEKKKVELMVNADGIMEKSGELATFVIHVKYRQNSTWQGDIFWTEKQEKRNFRSALEMLKLIDGALDQAEDDELEGETEE